MWGILFLLLSEYSAYAKPPLVAPEITVTRPGIATRK